jgi:PIN domain nuclease of toxin-antitoxin system
MTRYVVDAWAWLEYLNGSELGKSVEARFAEASQLFTSTATVAELVSRYKRRGMPEEVAVRAITTLSKVVGPGLDDAVEAGKVHAETKARAPNFSLSDATVLQLAKKFDAEVLTGDPDFQGIKDALMIE